MSGITRTIKLGTRGSALARWQTDHIAALLRQHHPDLRTETVIITTHGDRVIDVPLPEVGGKGVFTAELEDALRRGEIDFAVHSLKDLPTDPPAALTIGAIPPRASAHDVLVSRAAPTIDALAGEPRPVAARRWWGRRSAPAACAAQGSFCTRAPTCT
jgi:hydroxymethylbilane synthase